VTDLHEKAEIARTLTPEQCDAFLAYRARPIDDELGPVPECRPLVEKIAAGVAVVGLLLPFVL
jgi:hypothetical protein